MTAWVEFLRIAEIAVLVVTLAVLGARINRWWCTRWRCLLPAAGTGAIATLISIGNVDALLHDRPGGLSTVAVAAASVALLMQACTVGLGRSHDRARPHPGGGTYQAFRPGGDPTC